jgi:hypothetical protein
VQGGERYRQHRLGGGGIRQSWNPHRRPALQLGDFAPTGRRVEIRYCGVMRVADRKVVEGRDYYAAATIARRIGALDA